MSAPLVLTTSKICPFAHRAWLAASIKNVPITLDEVSLTNKEAHFTEVYQKAIGHTPSSDGKVPVLSHGDFVITESDVVAEYIDAAFPDSAPQLVPQDAALRARLRIFASQCVTPVFMAWYGVARAYKANKGKTDAEAEAARTAAKDNLTAAFKALESQIEGPFVLGNQITLADILVYPWFERLAVPEHYAQYEFPAQELTKLAQWRATVAALDGVKAIAQPGDYFVTSYASYYGEQ